MDNTKGYIVIDVETTGLSPQADRIVEIAIIRLSKDLQLEEWWTTLLNPQQNIGATHIHGISAEDVAGAPPFSFVAPNLYEELRARTLIAHNAKFDISFLESELARNGFGFRVSSRFCTMEHARRLAMKPATLEACCAKYGISNPAPHSAIGDAVSTMQLFRFMNRHGAHQRNRMGDSCPTLEASAFALSEGWKNVLLPRCPWLE